MANAHKQRGMQFCRQYQNKHQPIPFVENHIAKSRFIKFRLVHFWSTVHRLSHLWPTRLLGSFLR